MPPLVRLSFSLEEPLSEALSGLVEGSGYTNRSEFIRDLIRDRMVAGQWQRDEEAVGTITLVFNHHLRRLAEKLTDLQHRHHHLVLTTTHVHLDAHLCIEVVLARGRAGDIRGLADALRQQKGVLHGALTLSSTGSSLV
jgi:CopG family nickel-responsive transcriptional regulator